LVADAIDANLATPAQTVDVEAIREVKFELGFCPLDRAHLRDLADKLSQAIVDKPRG
jgi:hypothetical protein